MTHSLPSLSNACPVTADQAAMIEGACKVLQTERNGLTLLMEALRQALGDRGDATIAASGLGDAFIRTIEVLSTPARRVVVTGIGKSGHIGRKIQSTLASTGTPSIFVHPAEASHGDLGMLQPGDAILALSNSGETSELADIVSHARRFGLLLIAMTARAESTLARAADISLVLPHASEACPMGLAPTTSSTMQLALGDALAIVLLTRRGFGADDFGVFHPGGRLGAQLRSVRELMHTGPGMPLGAPDLPLRQVIMEMTRKAFGCMGVVGADGALVGLITDGDLRRALEQDIDGTRAADIMNTNPQTINPDALAVDALRIMNDRPRPITSLFVLNAEHQPIGILHIHDLLRAGVA
ncbi:KpsF/GutQ family sugar-phosphate isomerase [Novacetimonas pomaceti]|uniref:KpsF/GutQ family sugar-phosphate isomerase n=1 Tax=Novacetimonas pomaceti TaxID=2021998 RepID=A0A318QH06_9PROT|nr:KpsF/GutQ family sugar-phosphate isomerase [Novacetimonas pomaceti]MBV1833186.1 KpsF/GutQ family sugar-phosphate isomerase [Novacetimonas pomaceti]PYD48864.1 KpsF/GutQ family sugar-phosphate isomerase [Novacetimonas pomaceti]PYD76761.1 KpsF/GutQ family sugar-phosphate isomerase [Novacetimonas pomaceti]